MKSTHYDSDSEEARKNRKCKTENKGKRASRALKRPPKHTFSREEASKTIGKDFEGTQNFSSRDHRAGKMLFDNLCLPHSPGQFRKHT